MTTTAPDEPVVSDHPREWPDVAACPRRPLRAAIARRLFARSVAALPMRVVIEPDGPVLGCGTANDPVMRIVRADAFFHRLGAGGLIGFGESYMAGDWDAGEAGDEAGDALADLMEVFSAHIDELVPQWMQRLRRLGLGRKPDSERNTRAGSARNIARHYDLSNELFASFLDPSMTYSSALFDQGPRHRTATFDDLEAAQFAKVDRLLDRCGVGPGTRVLEIGTGWGTLALRAGARGATVRSITLSAEQADLARQRVDAAGLGDRVVVELADYRDLHGSYDAVLSVEMIEAVGEAYWPTYFEALRRCLAPGGRVGLQAITVDEERRVATRHDYTWIHKYVFPGGQVLSTDAIAAAAAAVDLDVVDDLGFGPDYATTLDLWRHRFATDGTAIEGFGDDPVFRRMWTFYLAYAESGFRSGYLDVHQIVLEAGDRP